MSTASDNLSAGLANLCESVRTVTPDPAVAIQLLIQLASFYPAVDVTGTAALCRRIALISLCRASAEFAPSSYQEAINLRAQIAELLDAEITVAADAGNDQTYQALRTLRQQVTADLSTKAGSLPNIITVNTAAPMPVLTLAWKLYADSTRADDLIARNNTTPNPNFMPVAFEALAS